VRLEVLGKLKKSTSPGIRTGDLPGCSIVPQSTTLPCAMLQAGATRTKMENRLHEDISGSGVMAPAFLASALNEGE
jgi:hypothetical protein